METHGQVVMYQWYIIGGDEKQLLVLLPVMYHHLCGSNMVWCIVFTAAGDMYYTTYISYGFSNVLYIS